MKFIFIGLTFVMLSLFISVEADAQMRNVQCRINADPLIVGASSFLIPGVGQFLNGQDMKGIWHLGIAVAMPTVVVIAARLMRRNISSDLGYMLDLAAPLLYLGWSFISASDAYDTHQSRCAT